MKTKLLLLNASANTGSTGRIAEEIGRLAQFSGYEVWMGYGRQYTANRKYAIMIKNPLLTVGSAPADVAMN